MYLLPISLFLQAGVAQSDKMLTPTERIVFGWPRGPGDEEEPDLEREKRLRDFAAIVDATTPNVHSRAALLVLASGESLLSRYVMENRCSDGPRGPKECDSGRATGPYQLHNAKDLAEDLLAQSQKAAALWRYHRRRCGTVKGAFGGYATGSACSFALAEKRAKRWRSYVSRLGG